MVYPRIEINQVTQGDSVSYVLEYITQPFTIVTIKWVDDEEEYLTRCMYDPDKDLPNCFSKKELEAFVKKGIKEDQCDFFFVNGTKISETTKRNLINWYTEGRDQRKLMGNIDEWVFVDYNIHITFTLLELGKNMNEELEFKTWFTTTDKTSPFFNDAHNKLLNDGTKNWYKKFTFKALKTYKWNEEVLWLGKRVQFIDIKYTCPGNIIVRETDFGFFLEYQRENTVVVIEKSDCVLFDLWRIFTKSEQRHWIKCHVNGEGNHVVLFEKGTKISNDTITSLRKNYNDEYKIYVVYTFRFKFANLNELLDKTMVAKTWFTTNLKTDYLLYYEAKEKLMDVGGAERLCKIFMDKVFEKMKRETPVMFFGTKKTLEELRYDSVPTETLQPMEGIEEAQEKKEQDFVADPLPYTLIRMSREKNMDYTHDSVMLIYHGETGNWTVRISKSDIEFFKRHKTVGVTVKRLDSNVNNHAVALIPVVNANNVYELFDPNGSIFATYGRTINKESLVTAIKGGLFDGLTPGEPMHVVFEPSVKPFGLQGIETLARREVIESYSGISYFFKFEKDGDEGYCATWSCFKIIDNLLGTRWYDRFEKELVYVSYEKKHRLDLTLKDAFFNTVRPKLSEKFEYTVPETYPHFILFFAHMLQIFFARCALDSFTFETDEERTNVWSLMLSASDSVRKGQFAVLSELPHKSILENEAVCTQWKTYDEKEFFQLIAGPNHINFTDIFLINNSLNTLFSWANIWCPFFPFSYTPNEGNIEKLKEYKVEIANVRDEPHKKRKQTDFTFLM